MQYIIRQHNLATIERLNNTIGHYKNNCKLCCWFCNCGNVGKKYNNKKITKTLKNENTYISIMNSIKEETIELSEIVLSEIDEHLSTLTVTDITKRKYKKYYVSTMEQAPEDCKSIFDIYTNDLLAIFVKSNHINQLSFITCMFKKSKPDVNIDVLLEYLNTLRQIKLANQPVKNKNLLDNSLSYDELMELLKLSGEQSIHEHNFLYHIILYLMINFNVRNTDLIITYLGIDPESLPTKTNYICFDKEDNLIYVRNDYKTNIMYGTQSHIITDTKIIDYFKNKISVGRNVFISMLHGIPYNNKSIYYYIKKGIKQIVPNTHALFPKNNVPINQQIIYKIIQQEHETNNDYKNLKLISKNRGHTLETQKAMYSSLKD